MKQHMCLACSHHAIKGTYDHYYKPRREDETAYFRPQQQCSCFLVSQGVQHKCKFIGYLFGAYARNSSRSQGYSDAPNIESLALMELMEQKQQYV